MLVRSSCPRMVLLLVTVVAVAVPGEAVASPARRLARRGVVVVPAPGAAVVVPPAAGPAPRPRRLMAVPVPPPPAPAGQPTVAKSSPPSDAQSPFTPTWYVSHPQAWRPAQPPADWWRSADVATVTSWLGQPVSTAGTAAAGAGSVTTAGADEVGADGLRSVLVLPAGHDNAFAAAGDDWLPLGVFAVVPQAEGQPIAQSHTFQQLAVDRKGAIKGNFYDTISDTLQPITGAVDRDTLTASWTVGTGGSRFTAPIRAFATAPRIVSVASGGTSRQLQMLPVPRPQ